MPIPSPLSPNALKDAAEGVIARAKFPMLATLEGDQPRVRPISPLEVRGFEVVFANLRSYGKTNQLAQNPKVELCYLDDQHHQLRIVGTVIEITDAAEKERLWEASPLLRKYLGSLENPALQVLKIVPNRVRFMQEWALEYQEVPFT